MTSKLLSNLASVYGWRGATTLTNVYVGAGRKLVLYLRSFWSTQNFATVSTRSLSFGASVLRDVVAIGMYTQLVLGVWLSVVGVSTLDPPLLCFGLAAVVSYPLVWAHLLPVLSLPGRLLGQIKPLGKRILASALERQVVALRQKHKFAVVAVAGSVGKTSTKVAISDALSVARRVRYQSGNYNVRLTVPLIFFGHDEPGIYNIPAWLNILRQNRKIINQDEYPYDVVVVELAPGGPGHMKKFAYIQPELGVLTSVAPEHMEVFKTIEGVAKEETVLFDFCDKVLINAEDVAAEFVEGKSYVSYGTDDATYAIKAASPAKKPGTQRVTFNLAGQKVSATIALAGRQGAKVALAAVAAASELALSDSDVKVALKHLRSFAGRMQILSGINGSTIIDDTYNASPLAVKAALDVVYAANAPQKIALLGNMNEMGDFSEEAHRDVGEYCDPTKLDLIVTLGADANKYLADSAESRGCTVVRCNSPYEAAAVIEEKLLPNALVLAKGSQNGVYAEEAVKQLLKSKTDSEKLVRQSAYWMKIKQRQFGDEPSV